MIEINIFLKPGSSKKHLRISFDDYEEKHVIQRLLRDGAENIVFGHSSISVQLKEKSEFEEDVDHERT